MGQVDIPQIEPMDNRSVEEYVRYLADMLAIIQEEMQNVLENRLSSENFREIAGYNVSETELKHKSGIVGMSGADPTDPNAVRFWAGNANKTAAPFRVQQNGTMYATDGNFEGDINGSVITGSLIQTAAAGIYPRIQLDSSANLLTAEYDAGSSVEIRPDAITGNPGLRFDKGLAGATISTDSVGLNDYLKIASNPGLTYIKISAGIDLILEAFGYVTVQNWGKFKNVDSGQTLQQSLDAKANASGYTGSFSTGSSIVNVVNGVITSVI